MIALLASFFAFISPSGPSADEILAAVSSASALRREVAYSGVRHYTIRNERFGKNAVVRVRENSSPGEGALFTIEERSGAGKIISVIEKLLDSEAESSRPGKAGKHQIGPSNYGARLRGSEVIGGHDCYVLDLTPKSKSKYLVSGTVWVDKATYGIVRLTGTTAASVSMWVGTPEIHEEFSQVDGVWMPRHLVSTSSSMLLGESHLEIRFADYQVTPGFVTARIQGSSPLKPRL
jgi:hypothetical protein